MVFNTVGIQEWHYLTLLQSQVLIFQPYEPQNKNSKYNELYENAQR